MRPYENGKNEVKQIQWSENQDFVDVKISKRNIIIPSENYIGNAIEIHVDGKYLFTATVGGKGEIQLARGSAIAEELEGVIDRKGKISIVPVV